MEPQGEKFVDTEKVLELNKIRAFYMPILLHFDNSEEADDQSSLILKIDGTKIQLGRLEEGNDRDNLLRAIEVLVREKIIEDNKHVDRCTLVTEVINQPALQKAEADLALANPNKVIDIKWQEIEDFLKKIN